MTKLHVVYIDCRESSPGDPVKRPSSFKRELDRAYKESREGTLCTCLGPAALADKNPREYTEAAMDTFAAELVNVIGARSLDQYAVFVEFSRAASLFEKMLTDVRLALSNWSEATRKFTVTQLTHLCGTPGYHPLVRAAIALECLAAHRTADANQELVLTPYLSALWRTCKFALAGITNQGFVVTPYHVMVLVAPRGGSYETDPNGTGLRVLAIEEPMRLDRALLKAILWVLGVREDSPEILNSLGAIPEPIRELPPGNWHLHSLPEWFKSVVPAMRPPDLAAAEVSDPEIRDEFVRQCGPMVIDTASASEPVGSDRGPRVNRIASHVLRVCRQLAACAGEHQPYRCTVLLTASPVKAILNSRKDTYHLCLELANGDGIPFSLASEHLRTCAEAAQSERMVMVVDALTGQLKQVVMVKLEPLKHDVTRRGLYEALAKAAHGLVIHIKGNGTVEVYNGEDICMWYVEGGWRLNPLSMLQGRLRKFFGGLSGLTDDLTRRVVGIVMSLLDSHSSSILGFTTATRLAELTKPPIPTTRPSLHLTRLPTAELAAVVAKQHIKAYPLDALVGLLQTDGAHFILNDGHLGGVGYLIPTAGGHLPRGGTGSEAARNLSEHLLSDEFVVQVSAGRGLKLYANGDAVFP